MMPLPDCKAGMTPLQTLTESGIHTNLLKAFTQTKGAERLAGFCMNMKFDSCSLFDKYVNAYILSTWRIVISAMGDDR